MREERAFKSTLPWQIFRVIILLRFLNRKKTLFDLVFHYYNFRFEHQMSLEFEKNLSSVPQKYTETKQFFGPLQK